MVKVDQVGTDGQGLYDVTDPLVPLSHLSPKSLNQDLESNRSDMSDTPTGGMEK